MAFTNLLNNHTGLERKLEQVAGEQIEALPLLIRALHNPDTCPVALLPWLAWAMSVDHWSDTWSEQKKRDVCKNSAMVHRYKGTIGAVTDALKALNISIEVLEPWQQDNAAPHSLLVRAYVNDAYLQAESDAELSVLKDINQILENTIPARCSFLVELGYEFITLAYLIVTSTQAIKLSSVHCITEAAA